MKTMLERFLRFFTMMEAASFALTMLSSPGKFQSDQNRLFWISVCSTDYLESG